MKSNLVKLMSVREKKPMLFAISVAVIAVVLVFVLLAGVKAMQFAAMGAASENFVQPPETVTTARVAAEAWETSLNAVGSVSAVQGVTISTEQSGTVESIAFTPGTVVEQGDLLVQLNIATEQAQLRAALAAAELAKINLDRSKELISKKLTSQSEYDAAAARYKEAVAQADNIRSLIDEKTIRAPFTGKIGVQNVHAGQFLNAGQPIVSLQSLEMLYVNFMLPQQKLTAISNGLKVRIESEVLPDNTSYAVITAIDPSVDPVTRNFAVQATMANEEGRLLPGMFVRVSVVLPEQETVLSIPATAVVHATYGDSVFVIDAKPNEKTGNTDLIARQQFVKLGKTRGDFVAVKSGLQENDLIVSTGAFKLYNGQAIVENNELAPEFQLEPKPENS